MILSRFKYLAYPCTNARGRRQTPARSLQFDGLLGTLKQCRRTGINLLQKGLDLLARLQPDIEVHVRRVLEKNGFKVGQVTPVATNGASQGIILTQSPPPGSKIGSDAVFSFQVTQ